MQAATKPSMKKIFFASIVLATLNASAFEILALGTSNTKCKYSWESEAYPAQLEILLREDGIDATVVNAGVNGDRPASMISRLPANNSKTKLVILEPGPNERNKAYNLEYSEAMLKKLQEMAIPTIYITNNLIQTHSEGEETAKKYGAYYFGQWGQLLSGDYLMRDGHLTAKGCKAQAGMLLYLVKQVIAERNIK